MIADRIAGIAIICGVIFAVCGWVGGLAICVSALLLCAAVGGRR